MATLATWPSSRTDADETKWSKMISLQRRDGIYKNAPGTVDFTPFGDSSGMHVKVGSGEVIMSGFHGQSTTQQIIELDPPDASNSRIDLIVFHLDRQSPATISIIPVKGTPAVNPAVPALTNTTRYVEQAICQILVEPRISAIAFNKVVDLRTYTADRLLGTVNPQNISTLANIAAGKSGVPADAAHVHGFDPILIANSIIPAGLIAICASTNSDIGWLFCDGEEVSRAQYPALFAKLGTYWGSGNGASTFNVPNLTDRVPVQRGPLHPFGATGGTASMQLSQAHLPTHAHGITDKTHNHVINDPTHIHGPSGSGGATGYVFGASGSQSYSLGGPSGTGGVTFVGVAAATSDITLGGSSTGITSTNNTGSSTPFSIEQPWLSINYQIKAH